MTRKIRYALKCEVWSVSLRVIDLDEKIVVVCRSRSDEGLICVLGQDVVDKFHALCPTSGERLRCGDFMKLKRSMIST